METWRYGAPIQDTPMQRRHHAVTLEQATREAPMLSRLAGLARESGDWLRMASELLPPSMRGMVRPGPIGEDGVWCLLVDNAAAAAKLRQLAPAMAAHLRSKGKNVKSIRLKVHHSRY